MAQKILTLKVEKRSGIGALALVRNAPGHLSPDSPLAPVMLYLENLAPSGHRTQRGTLERAARLLGGTNGLDYEWFNVRSSHLELLRGMMRGKGFSPSLINSTISAVRGVARWAMHLGQMAESDYIRLRDVRMVQNGTDRRRPARALRFEEIAALFASCEAEESLCALRDACLLALLYAGGLRRDEACRLPLDAFSRRTHTLLVHGKGDKNRTAYFRDGGARRAINAWLRARGDSPGAFICPVNRHGQVMLDGEQPAHLSASGLYRALERRAEKAGIDHFTPHDLRRSFGTHLTEAGVTLDLVRQLFGHVEISTTQRYLMTTEKAKAQASMKIHVPFRTGTGKGRRKKKRRRRN